MTQSLLECWPLCSDGPLPRDLLPEEFVGAAFFQTLAAQQTWPASALRRGLKQMAKRLKVPFDRSHQPGGDLTIRDHDLAFRIFDTARGRQNLKQIQVRIDDVQGRRTQGEWICRIPMSLPEVFWSHLLRNPEHSALTDWALGISIDRPDLGRGYYITAEALTDAIDRGEPPPDVEDPAYARSLLLFAATLPDHEALDLLRAGAVSGAPALAEFRSEAQGSVSAVAPISDLLSQEAAGAEAGTVLLDLKPASSAGPQLDWDDLEMEAAAPPSPVANAQPLIDSLTALQERFGEALALATKSLGADPGALLHVSDEEFETRLRTVHAARAAREALIDSEANVRQVCVEQFSAAYAAAQLCVPEWLKEACKNAGVDHMLALLAASDVVQQFAASAPAEVRDFAEWREELSNATEIGQVLEEFRRLPAICRLARKRSEARRRFLEEARQFASEAAPADIEEWLTRAGTPEIALLVDGFGASMPAVCTGALVRFGLDRDTAYVNALNTFLRGCDLKVRRAALLFVDPSSAIFDDAPALQRIIAVERLRDALDFGPLAALTDPTVRLTDSTVVGTPVAELVTLLIRHLDLLPSGAELRRLLQPRSGARGSSGADLAQFAQTPPNSTGTFGLLRETAREMFFLPLMRGDQIDRNAAKRLLAEFTLEDAIELVIEEAKGRPSKQPRIEVRHRVHLERYLLNGQQLLKAFAGAGQPGSGGRLKSLANQLAEELQRLGSSGGEPGTQPWLEREVHGLLQATQADDRLKPTLIGKAEAITCRDWTTTDTIHAQEDFDLAEFYLPVQLTTFEVAAVGLKLWASGISSRTEDVIRELLSRGEYPLALALIEESDFTPPESGRLRECVLDSARDAIGLLESRLDSLVDGQPSHLIDSAEAVRRFKEAAAELDAKAAAEQLDLLELEVAEWSSRIDTARSDAEDPDRHKLVRLLLQAGVEGIDEWSMSDLENRWAAELQARLAERTHLKLLERLVEAAADADADVAADLATYASISEAPERWLPEERSAELAILIEDGTEKLRTWLQLSSSLDPSSARAVTRLVHWFFKFVIEHVGSLRSLENGESTDPILEHVLEACESINQAANPKQTVEALARMGEMEGDQEPDGSERATGSTLETSTSETSLPEAVRESPAPAPNPGLLGELIARGDWRGLQETCRRSLTDVSEEEASRLQDIADFCEAVLAIDENRHAEAIGTLVTAARVLGANGQLINRTLPRSRQLRIAFCLTSAALKGTSGGAVPEPSTDGSWRPLLGLRSELGQALLGSSPASRVVEHLCAGALGREVVDRIWEAPTNSDPGPLRAQLLAFLHERRLDEHILLLAQRYEAAIKPRLSQLLELRAITPQRPDLIPVSNAVAAQVRSTAQSVPFRTFIDRLPSAMSAGEADLRVTVDDDLMLRVDRRRLLDVTVSVTVDPHGLVPELLEVTLFPEDDVTFEDGMRRRSLSDQPLYMPRQFPLAVRFGPSWADEAVRRGSFRMRMNSRLLGGQVITRDVACPLIRTEAHVPGTPRIDTETLLESYPGVENTPALGAAFVGRREELERLHDALIAARRPSPVLLTGMRRIGKTSLLFAFHGQHRRPERDRPVTVYCSLAEKRAALMDPAQDVASVFYSAIAHALGKKHFSASDHNREVGERLAQKLGPRDGVKNAFLELRDRESLSDSLTLLSEHLLQWLGGARRVVFLIDEAETLVLPYRAGGTKRLELEQFLQGLREVSQTSPAVGLLLSGSNHIAEFARSYKNAFFGSSIQLDLGGMTDFDTARRILAPASLRRYVDFQESAIRYGIDMCAGMPQFMWQLGAATTFAVRSGQITKADVRAGVSALIGEGGTDLPFKAYDVLEPVEHMLGLQGQREQDLHWLLLWRVANSSSLVANEAQQSVIIDQSLLELDEADRWKARLLSLVDLEILEMPRASMYRFRVPIFAEGFRSPRHQQTYHLRHQRAGA